MKNLINVRFILITIAFINLWILRRNVVKCAKRNRNFDDNVLHIGGIFPIAGQIGWQGGQVN